MRIYDNGKYRDMTEKEKECFEERFSEQDEATSAERIEKLEKTVEGILKILGGST